MMPKAGLQKSTTKKKSQAISKEKPKAKPKAKTSVVYKLNEGDPLPPFEGDSTSGQSILHDTHSTFVLYFYPRDNTPGCTLEGQDFRRLYAQFKKEKVAIIGVSQDSVESHQKFKSKCDFPFDLLSDEDGSVCKSFDVIQVKSMYGREFEGIERSTFLVKKGVIRKVWRKVKVDQHVDEVLRAVKDL